MNSIHDMGGMDNMGPIAPEPNEPVFHEEWERRGFGMFIATFAGGLANVDAFRHAIEKMPPGHYLESSYYEHWLSAIERLLIERGLLTEDEMRQRMAQLGGTEH